MLRTDVAPGIHRVGDAGVNWYIVEDGGRLTLADAGLPSCRSGRCSPHGEPWRTGVAAAAAAARSAGVG